LPGSLVISIDLPVKPAGNNSATQDSPSYRALKSILRQANSLWVWRAIPSKSSNAKYVNRNHTVRKPQLQDLSLTGNTGENYWRQ